MSNQRSSLGRGLSSLIPDAAWGREAAEPKDVLRHVPIDEIAANPEQPREVFAPADLEALVQSIREVGVMIPLVVRREEGRYILIAGERRLRAAALAGLVEVPVVVREAPTEREQLELALIENLLRTDLDPIECARGYQRLVETYGLTQDEVAARVGRDRATVANAIRLLRLPEFVLAALRNGQLTSGHARALLPLADNEPTLRRTLSEVVHAALSVRATEALVRKRRPDASPSTQARPEPPSAREEAFARVARDLSDKLQTEVQIRGLRKGGKITLHFSDDETFEYLANLLGTHPSAS